MTQNIMFLCGNPTATVCQLFMEKRLQINPHQRSQDRIRFSQALTHTYALSPPACSTGASNIKQATLASSKSGRTAVACESSETLCWKKDDKRVCVCVDTEKSFFHFKLAMFNFTPFWRHLFIRFCSCLKKGWTYKNSVKNEHAYK